jgi:hypothetical protein
MERLTRGKEPHEGIISTITTSTSVPDDDPELEDEFENAIFPDSDSNPPNLLPAWLLTSPLDALYSTGA